MFGEPSRRERKRLESAGVRASATVVEMSDRGMAITHGSDAVVANTEIALKLKLRVQPPGQPSFEVRTKLRFPQLAVPAVGQTIAVIVDPDDHETLMLDESVPGQLGAFTQQLHEQGLRQDQIDSITVAQQMAAAGADPQAILERINEIRAAAGQPPAQTFGEPAPASTSGFTAAAAPAPAADPIAQLERLAALRDRGVLTESEFQAQKARLLGTV